jgi:signal transduction histidine kinase
VSRLVVELGLTATRGGLDGLLAGVLGDTSVELAYPLGDGRYVDRDGTGRTLPPADGGSWTPITRNGAELAVLIHRAGLFEEIAAFDDLTTATGLILENERLQAQASAREGELRESRIRLVETSDAERRRLERDLHDGAQQRLVVLLIGARVARAQTTDDGPLATELDRIVCRLEAVIGELRQIAHGIHPSVLTDDGLPAALEALADQRDQLRLSVVGFDDERLPRSVEHAAYQIVAESSRCGPTDVTATHADEAVSIDVHAPAVPDTIVELEDRVGALGGSILINASAGSPISMRVEIPCAS